MGCLGGKRSGIWLNSAMALGIFSQRLLQGTAFDDPCTIFKPAQDGCLLDYHYNLELVKRNVSAMVEEAGLKNASLGKTGG